MKTIEIDIPDFEKDNFFFALRNKLDYVLLLSNACRLILIDHMIDHRNIQSVGKLKVIVDKMCRLFVFTDDKKFSVHFPFTIELSADGVSVDKLYLRSGEEIDNLKLAAINAVVRSDSFKLAPSVLNYYFMEKDIDEEGLSALEEIILSESSYIRYDYDDENENGRLHPINHIDVNYSSNGTFKLGLYEKMSDTDFVSLVNIRTDCKHFEQEK